MVFCRITETSITPRARAAAAQVEAGSRRTDPAADPMVEGVAYKKAASTCREGAGEGDARGQNNNP